MGRPRTTIKKLASGKWALTRPAYGFAPSDTSTTEYPSYQALLDSVNRPAMNSQGGGLERRPQYSDGVGAVSGWSPVWHFHRSRDWIPLEERTGSAVDVRAQVSGHIIA